MTPYRRIATLLAALAVVALVGISTAVLPAQEKKDAKKADAKKDVKKDEAKKDEPKKADKEPPKEPPKEPLKLDAPQAELKGHTYWVTRVAFAADGKHLVSASRDRTLKLWDLGSGKEVKTVKVDTPDLKAMVVLKDFQVAVPAGKWNKEKKQWQGEIKIIDAKTGKEMRLFKGHTEPIEALAVSADGFMIASGGEDQTIMVWGVLGEGGVMNQFKGHSGPVFALAFSPDGKHLISGGRAAPELPKTDAKAQEEKPKKTEKDVKKEEKKAKQAKAKKDDKKKDVKAKDEPVKGPAGATYLWDLDARKLVSVFKKAEREVVCAAWSNDNKYAAVGALDGTIRIIEPSTGDERILKAHEGVWAVAFSPDSKRLATGGWDQRIKIWDVASGKEVRNINAHAGTVTTLAFSADGQRLVSGGTDNLIKIWQLGK